MRKLLVNALWIAGAAICWALIVLNALGMIGPR